MVTLILLHPLENQTASTLTWYPTQSHYRDTKPTSPYTILIKLSAWLESDKYQLLSHWFDLTKVRTAELHIPRSLKTGEGRSTHSAILFGCGCGKPASDVLHEYTIRSYLVWPLKPRLDLWFGWLCRLVPFVGQSTRWIHVASSRAIHSRQTYSAAANIRNWDWVICTATYSVHCLNYFELILPTY